MKNEHLIELINKLSKERVTFQLNEPVEDSMSNVHQCLILECSASVIESLVKAGYSLFMSNKGLSVDKFK